MYKDMLSQGDFKSDVMEVMRLLENMDTIIFVIDQKTRQVYYANKKALRVFGLDDIPLFKQVEEVFFEDGKDSSGFLEKCTSEGCENSTDSINEHELFYAKTARYIKFTTMFSQWDGANVVFLQGVDISEQRKNEEILKKEAEQQRLISEISGSFISASQFADLANDAFKNIGEYMGIDSLHVVKHDASMFPDGKEYAWSRVPLPAPKNPEMRLANLENARKLFSDKGVKYKCTSNVAKDPFFAPLEARGIKSVLSAPILVEGTLIGVISAEQRAHYREWTESDIMLCTMVSNVISSALARDKVEKDSRENEELVRALFDNSPFACTLFNSDYNPIQCNEAVVRMYGLNSKEEYLENHYKFSPELQPDGSNSRESAVAHLKQAFEKGKHTFEWNHCYSNGDIIPVEVILIKMRWRGEDRIVAYTSNISELKTQMKKLEEAQAELIVERDKANASAQAKSSFLANMSHEIRTPMNAIIGMIDIAKVSDDPEKVLYCLHKVDDAANHLLGVINDILDMSKIEAGKFEINYSDFVIEKMLLRISNFINFKVDQKHQNFIIKVDKDVPQAILCDQQRLSQVVTNLLSNAVKFTPERGDISLMIHNVKGDNERCRLLFEVFDTGIGITEEMQKNLFQSFVQADGSISRRFGGTGLGLAISKNIIELMGGTIGVESSPEKGSRFFFEVDVQIGKASYESKLNPLINWKKVKLLVVDDSPEICEYFSDIANVIGVPCDTAGDAYVATSLIEEGNMYNIIFVDWMMPGMDGIEFTRKVREYYKDENVIVIMISAVDWAEIEKEAQNAGVNKFISKPLLPSPIIDCINECMGAQPGFLESEAPAGHENQNIFKGKKVLLAEDIEINREILITLLSDTGVDVVSAENGAVAVEKFSQSPDEYDLIFMDIHMPEVDGYEATRQIRSLDIPEGQSVPIVAMTANVFKEDIEKCLESGMNDHIGKPLDLEELMKKTKEYLL